MSHVGKFPIHPSDTPSKAFDRAMRYRMFYYAAQIARDYGLGADLVREAAFKAYCAFDRIGAEISKMIVLIEFGLVERTVVLAADGMLRLPDDGFPRIFPSSSSGAQRQPN